MSMQNTEVHNELAYDKYKELKESGQHTKQHRKSIALVAAMRLNQHQPNESLEILSIHNDIDVNIRYVRMLSYAYLKQFHEVIRLLRMTITPPINVTPPKIPKQLVNDLLLRLYPKSNALIAFYSYRKLRRR